MNCLRQTTFAVLAAVVFVSCEESSQKPIEEKFEGILQMDNMCNVLGGDATDFLPRPEVCIDTTVVPPVACPPKNYSLVGACPNPSDGGTEIQFAISEIDSVWIFAYDRPGLPPVDTLFNQGNRRPGVYTVVWQSPSGPGIYRIRMFTASGFRSYGDVQFTN